MVMLVFFGPVSLARPEQVNVTIHTVNFPPYEIESPGRDGLRGFDIEVAIEAFKRVGVSAKIEFLPWNRILSMARKGTTVAALSCAKTKDRDHFIYYSDPISKATHVYVALKDFKGMAPQKLLDAKGFKIVAVRGYTNEFHLKKEKIKYQYAMNDVAALNLLLNRDFDFFYSTGEFVKYVATELNIADQLQYFELQTSKAYHLCFSRFWPNVETLRDRFNRGLAEIRADGTFDAIHQKYK
ncbi:MAG: transporter substrate-binding domain-containing protein [Sneathiella sp.]|nr:transporter substrate-binding domain-containing protein [Sneathiella sp.]